MRIIFDIESFGIKPSLSEVNVPKTYKKTEAIEKYQKENQYKQWRDNSANIFRCKIICLSYKLDMDETKHLIGSEKDIMLAFEAIIKGIGSERFALEWLSYNGTNFDIPILQLRGMKYGCKHLLDSLPKSGSDKRNIDLMTRITPTLWKGWTDSKLKGCYTFANVCNYLGIPVKQNGVDGSKVFDLYMNKEMDKIAAYCDEDVDALVMLAEKMQVREAVTRSFF
jgi:uncharacterized protein YprB with RNaseH-like and TPR domain